MKQQTQTACVGAAATHRDVHVARLDDRQDAVDGSLQASNTQTSSSNNNNNMSLHGTKHTHTQLKQPLLASAVMLP